jgi:HEAT repeat protein
MIGQKLKDPDVMVRDKAAKELKALGPLGRAAAPQLVAALSDNRLRVAALDALRGMAIEAIPVLLGALRTETGEARRCVIEALGSAGSAAKSSISPLEQVLREGDSLERLDAAIALARIDDNNQATQQFFKPFLKSSKREDRLIAVNSLSRMRIDSDEGARVVVDLLKEKDLEVPNTMIASVALWRYGAKAKSYSAPVTRLLKERSKKKEQRLTAALLAGALLRVNDPSTEVKTIAIREMDVFEELLNLDDDFQEFAVDTLGRLGAPAQRALPQLRKALNHRNTRVRSAAAEAIKKIDPQQKKE